MRSVEDRNGSGHPAPSRVSPVPDSWRVLLDAVPAAVLIVAPDGTISAVNAEFERPTGPESSGVSRWRCSSPKAGGPPTKPLTGPTRSGIVLVKYWLSISDEEQERRFQLRIRHPHKRWKLSTIDLESRAHWVDYSEAKDEMFAYTDTKDSPWWVVEADDKRSARLNIIRHLLGVIPYERLPFDDVTLPPRQRRAYARPPKQDQTIVEAHYEVEDRRRRRNGDGNGAGRH